MLKLMVCVAVMIGCATSEPGADARAPTQAQEPPPGCPAPAAPAAGGSCVEAPYPALTACHGDDGWCVAGTCRAMCAAAPPGCPRCAIGTEAFSDRGACYCSE